MIVSIRVELNTFYNVGLPVVNRMITGLVCSADNTEGSCKISESKVGAKLALAFTAA